MLEVNNVSTLSTHDFHLNQISFTIDEGDWLMAVGPNGAGKSTLIRAIAGGIDYEGEIRYNQQDIKAMPSKERAKAIGILMQHQNTAFNYTVEEIVGLGRYPYKKGLYSTRTKEDQVAIDNALEITGITKYRDRSIQTLSGGEQQRTFLAQVFAQNPSILILDEPANHLDLTYQEIIFNIIKDWLNEGLRAVMTVVHDLTTAHLYGSKGVLFNHGTIQAKRAIKNIMTAKHLNPVYNTDVYRIMKDRSKIWLEDDYETI